MKLRINYASRNIKYLSMIIGMSIPLFYGTNNLESLTRLSIIFFTIAIASFIIETYTNPDDLRERKTNKILRFIAMKPPKYILVSSYIFAFAYIYYILFMR